MAAETRPTSTTSHLATPETPEVIGRRWALVLSGSAAAIAITVLGTWWFGDWSMLALGPRYVPMAPATAMLVLILAVVIILRARDAGGTGTPARVTGWLSTATALAAAIIGGAALLEIPLGVEGWLSRTDASVGGILVGRVSRHTAALILVLSLGLSLGHTRADRRNAQVAAALVVIGACFVILQGYVLGGPLLYETGTIPVAATTALALLLLGLAFLLIVGTDRWPLRLVLPGSADAGRASRWAFRTLTLAIALLVLSSGYLWHEGERQRAEERGHATLASLANLKADELSIWYAGHLSTARALGSLPLSLESAASWLADLRGSADYAMVALLDPDGTPRMVTPSGHPLDTAAASARLSALQSTPAILFDDVHEDGGELAMKLWVPLSTPNVDQRPWLLLEIDVVESLFPLVRSLPVGSETTELLLWRQEGDSAVLVTGARLTGAAPLTLRFPLEDGSPMPVVGAMLAGNDATEGIDYRGMEVAFVSRRVEGTPWILVAKMDRSELLVPVVRSAIGTTVVSLLLLLGTVTALYAIWSRRELRLVQEREATDLALRESEARYARAMRAAIDGLWEWHIPTGVVSLSPKWRAVLGLEASARLNIETAFLSRLHPEDVARVQDALDAHLEEGVPYEIEFRMRDASDTYRWFWAKGEAECDAAGEPVRVAGGISDVSGRKGAEEALLRTDRILRVRSACNLALVHTTSEEALLQAVAEVAVREGGYRMAWIGYAEQDDARSVRPVAVSGDERGYLELARISWNEGDPYGMGPTGRCIRTGEPQAAQDVGSDPALSLWRDAALERGYRSGCAIPLQADGTTIGALMLYSGEPRAFDLEEISLLTELGNDLSFGIRAKRDARVVAEQQAKLTLFRQAIERSSDAFFVADAETGRFVDFNETAAKQLGYSVAELRELGAADIVPGISSPSDWQESVDRIRRGEIPVRRSFHVRKDGTRLPVEISFSVIEGPDGTLVLGIARDVSEREAAEREQEALRRQLEQAQKMESVGRLAGGVAHDFNNLLTVVNATADMALSDMPENSPLREDLEQIRAAGDRAATLTRQLLAFSRQQVMHRRTVALNEVITDFLGMVQRVIGEHIRVETKLAEDLESLHADPGQLEQVLMNLCLNARDAMPRGGTLTIETQNVEVDQDQAASHVTMRPGPHVLLSVSDTGTGMDEETCARVFDPFFTTKSQGKGTGLGLSTAYGIVKQTGGSIWVYSELGLGTTFKIYLPVARDGETTDVALPPPTARSGSERILIVEDEPAIRQLVRRLLKNAGYDVVEAASGHEALTRIGDQDGPPIDLVLTDLVMPGMSGTQLAATLDRDHPHVKIILATGYSTEAVADRLPAHRKWNLIGKPYAIDYLLREVRRVLDE